MGKRGNLIAALAALCLVLGGCALFTPAWHFETEIRRVTYEQSYANDGTPLAVVDYELPRLTLAHDALAHSAEPPEEMAAARDTFNDAMERFSAGLPTIGELRAMAASGKTLTERAGFAFRGAYLCRVSPESFYQTQRLLSVCARGEEYTGGAHTLPFAVVWNYDLERGEFLLWGDFTDRPDDLRAKLIEETGAADLEGAQVYFAGDGAHIVFSVYQIAPFSEGTPEFIVSYETLAPYWNARGRELLKKGD